MRRGHNVTLCANEIRGSNLFPGVPERVGVKFVSAGYDPITLDEFNEVHRSMQSGVFNMSMSARTASLFDSFYHQVRAKVEEIGMDRFDIVVSEISAFPVGAYLHEKGMKSVVFSTLMLAFPAANLLPRWPTPLVASGQSDDLSFVERFFNLIFKSVFLEPKLRAFIERVPQLDPQYNAVLGGKNLQAYPGLRIPLIFNTAFGFDYPKERYPLVSYVGPVLMNSLPPIDKELLEWLDSKEEKTVIYISMGTTGILEAKNAEGLVEGVMSTPYHAVWVVKKQNRRDSMDLEAYGERLFVAEWVSQQAVLQHRAILLSILHCGLNGIQESLSNSLPIICAPLGYDQFEMAAKVHNHGVGVTLYGFTDSLRGNRDITAERVKESIEYIVSSDCAANASRIRRIFKLAGGRERAADLVEFYEDVGYDHLVPSFVKYEWSWVQYYNLDVWLGMFGVCGLVGWLSWRLVRRLLRKCCC